MAASEIRSFVERAKATGISDEALVGMLTARGWPEKDVYQELAVLYEGLTGIEIPNRRGSGAAAKDAFFYLLTFAALATWTIGLASLAFTLIEHWFADTLFNGRADYALYEASTSMASVLLAYPLYLLLSRLVARETRLHPEKLNSPVRKWLTYMALVIAAGVILGDLITAVDFLLRGVIERFDIGQNMPERHATGTNFLRGEPVKHEGVVRIRAMGADNFGWSGIRHTGKQRNG